MTVEEHDDAKPRKQFPHYWLMDSPHQALKGQYCGTSVFLEKLLNKQSNCRDTHVTSLQRKSLLWFVLISCVGFMAVTPNENPSQFCFELLVLFWLYFQSLIGECQLTHLYYLALFHCVVVRNRCELTLHNHHEITFQDKRKIDPPTTEGYNDANFVGTGQCRQSWHHDHSEVSVPHSRLKTWMMRTLLGISGAWPLRDEEFITFLHFSSRVSLPELNIKTTLVLHCWNTKVITGTPWWLETSGNTKGWLSACLSVSGKLWKMLTWEFSFVGIIAFLYDLRIFLHRP